MEGIDLQATPRMKKIYTEIQKQLFYMIPEKWDRVYLYASVIEGINHLETGEMFFYYFPKGILKKEPVNVYEVPNKYNIDEKEYFKQADELYGWLKELRKEIKQDYGKIWTNLTISIENFKFIVEFHYEDLAKCEYNSYERHILWRYHYLGTGINTYNKKEKSLIFEYLNRKQTQMEIDEYTEGIYQNPVHHVITYNKEEKEEFVPQEIKKIEAEEIKKNQILNYHP